jgi:hypothetical protein
VAYPLERQGLQVAYREGIFARALGRECCNPHPPDTSENILWEKGWRLIDATRREPSIDPFVGNLVPDFTPEEHPNANKVDALASLLRCAVLGAAVAFWLMVYLLLWR